MNFEELEEEEIVLDQWRLWGHDSDHIKIILLVLPDMLMPPRWGDVEEEVIVLDDQWQLRGHESD
ncbi:hypothetical protein Tsubulata_033818 [Turnera subulata]|uniref:Uncharacterized protein n=1 Tax=Turnera subulata TaxID=218843 RepID=A0A9Q0FPN6_9ROSI|nr:hypothetical protein Tsubulata_042199 [Turnera subulata]KAJ4835458.1 hypothetical protein Tsubulata_033818 [Turnera subulata]